MSSAPPPPTDPSAVPAVTAVPASGAGDTDRAGGLAGAVRALREVILAAEHYRLAAATHLGLSVTDSQAISYLFARGALGQNDFATALEMSTGSITAMIDRLAARGLVERNPHPTDRRRTIIELSPAGSQALADVRNWMEEVFDAVPTDGLRQRTTMLGEIADGLHARAERVPVELRADVESAHQPRRRR